MRRRDGRWGAPHSVSFQIMEEEEVSLLLQGLDSNIDQYAGHTSQEGESSVYCSKSPFPLSDNNTYGTIATLTTSHIRRFAEGRLHILITNDGQFSSAI